MIYFSSWFDLFCFVLFCFVIRGVVVLIVQMDSSMRRIYSTSRGKGGGGIGFGSGWQTSYLDVTLMTYVNT